MSIMKFFHRMGIIAANVRLFKMIMIAMTLNNWGLIILLLLNKDNYPLLKILGFHIIILGMLTFIAVRLEVG